MRVRPVGEGEWQEFDTTFFGSTEEKSLLVGTRAFAIPPMRSDRYNPSAPGCGHCHTQVIQLTEDLNSNDHECQACGSCKKFRMTGFCCDSGWAGYCELDTLNREVVHAAHHCLHYELAEDWRERYR